MMMTNDGPDNKDVRENMYSNNNHVVEGGGIKSVMFGDRNEK